MFIVLFTTIKTYFSPKPVLQGDLVVHPQYQDSDISLMHLTEKPCQE